MDDLFRNEPAAPLAEALRPRTIDEVIGQSHLLGPGKPLNLAELVKALKQPNVRARFALIGAEPVGSSPRKLANTLQVETVRWAKIVRERNIKAD